MKRDAELTLRPLAFCCLDFPIRNHLKINEADRESGFQCAHTLYHKLASLPFDKAKLAVLRSGSCQVVVPHSGITRNMPKKTRKQKLRADKRHVQPILNPVNGKESVIHPASEPTFAYQATVSAKTQARLLESQTELMAIRGDIAKTVVLAGIAIAVELAVYWRFYR